MWPFSKQKSQDDLAIEWMPRAIEVAAQKWADFQVLKFKDEVPLEMRIMSFAIPLEEGLRQWKAFKDVPQSIFLLIAAKGVEKSGTHTKAQIESALSIPLPS